MKKLVLNLLFLPLAGSLFSQSMNFSADEKSEIKTTIKGNYNKLSVYNNKYLIAVSTEETTVFDLSTGKKKTAVIFPGSDDKIWVSRDGKYAAGTTQQYSPEGKKQINIDGFHYYNFETGKMDSYSITDQRLVGDIDFSEKSTDLLMVYTSAVPNSEKTNHALSIYNPFTKEERIIYNSVTTGSFGKAPIMACYSKDEAKIFLYTAEGILCRFTVFETSTGKQLYSEIIKHASAYYETDEYLLLAGYDEKAGYGLTTKHDKSTYKQLDKWINKEIVGITPDEKSGIYYDYTNKKLQKINIADGKTTDWTPFDGTKMNISTLLFNKDGSQAFVAVVNKYEKEPSANKVGIYVFGKSTDVVPTNEDTVSLEKDTIVVPVDTWVQYKSTNPLFEVMMSTKATESVTTSKGKKTVKLTAGDNIIAYSVVASELSNKVKAEKYDELSVKLAESLIKKGYTKINEENYTLNEQKGKRYLLKKGDFYYHYVSICTNGYAYQLLQASKEKNESSAGKFINSFMIK